MKKVTIGRPSDLGRWLPSNRRAGTLPDCRTRVGRPVLGRDRPRSPRTAGNQEAVHSQTLPTICRQPKALSPSLSAATRRLDRRRRNRGWPREAVGGASPHGQRRRLSLRAIARRFAQHGRRGLPIRASLGKPSAGPAAPRTLASNQLTKTTLASSGASGSAFAIAPAPSRSPDRVWPASKQDARRLARLSPCPALFIAPGTHVPAVGTRHRPSTKCGRKLGVGRIRRHAQYETAPARPDVPTSSLSNMNPSVSVEPRRQEPPGTGTSPASVPARGTNRAAEASRWGVGRGLAHIGTGFDMHILVADRQLVEVARFVAGTATQTAPSCRASTSAM